jgi:hypothetical protein
VAPAAVPLRPAPAAPAALVGGAVEAETGLPTAGLLDWPGDSLEALGRYGFEQAEATRATDAATRISLRIGLLIAEVVLPQTEPR